MKILWKLALVAVNFVHYATCGTYLMIPAVVFVYLGCKYSIEDPLTVIISAVITGVSGYIAIAFVWVRFTKAFNGCPFTHLQHYVEVKCGLREEIDYSFLDSNAYRYVVEPLGKLRT